MLVRHAILVIALSVCLGAYAQEGVKSRVPQSATTRLKRDVARVAEVSIEQVIITKVRDERARATNGFRFEYAPKPKRGVWGGFLDLSNRRAPILEIDAHGVGEDDARDAAQAIIDDAFAAATGKPDVREQIARRGDPAGSWVGDAIDWVVDWFDGDGDDKDASANPPEDAGVPQEKPGSENPPMGTNEPVDPPEDPGKTPNPVNDTGGRLTPAQLVRVRIALANYVPPARDDRDPRQGGEPQEPDKPIDRYFDPAINWGPDHQQRAKVYISTRIVPNDGYTDPIRH